MGFGMVSILDVKVMLVEFEGLQSCDVARNYFLQIRAPARTQGLC